MVRGLKNAADRRSLFPHSPKRPPLIAFFIYRENNGPLIGIDPQHYI